MKAMTQNANVKTYNSDDNSQGASMPSLNYLKGTATKG